MKGRNSKAKLIALTVTTAILLNSPVLETVNKQLMLFGIPLLYFYVFLIWILFIIILYNVSKNSKA